MLSATSSTCLSPQYEYWVLPPGGSWTIMQSWNTASTFSWDPAANGTYQLAVWTKDATSTATFDTGAILTFTIAPESSGDGNSNGGS